MNIKQRFKKHAEEFVKTLDVPKESHTSLLKILNGCTCGCNNGGFVDYVLQNDGIVKIKESAKEFTDIITEKKFINEKSQIFLLKFLYKFIEYLKEKDNE